MENKVPLPICYLFFVDLCYFAVSAISLVFRRQQQLTQHEDKTEVFTGALMHLSADKLQRTKDRASDAIREVSFRRGLRPTATALQQLQREAAPRRVGAGKSCERHSRVLRQGSINLALSLHSVTPFLSPSPPPPPTSSLPHPFSRSEPRRSFCRAALL
jgi:hypothetical protein